MDPKGKLQIDFPKEVDWSYPIFLVLESYGARQPTESREVSKQITRDPDDPPEFGEVPLDKIGGNK
jgi:hypothetical protein